MYKYFIYILLAAQLSTDVPKKLIKKWRLITVEMGDLVISEQELKSKRGDSVIEFLKDGTLITYPSHPVAKIKKNKWELSNDSTLVIFYPNDNQRIEQQKFTLEQLTTKRLRLSIGEEQNKEYYTYKAIK